jgi:4-hydroxy-tetrahydrodipicolinate reductase
LTPRTLNLVLLGQGKTGSIVAEVARERGHRITSLTETENADGTWLTPENLRGVNVVIDFTAPDAVLNNIARCVAAKTPMVVGTTGWYRELDRIKREVEQAGTGFVFGSNFSYGVNLFFQIARTAARALQHGYVGHITETHHVHKKDAPSGTAIALQRVIEQASGIRTDISSMREGDVPGIHTLELSSAGDRMLLAHEVKSRRTFAEGAVLAAEWIAGKTGFYDFKDIFGEL